jgi:YesN/AraC family two-component response regulator
MSKKLLPDIERLFNKEKIYTQSGLTVDDVAKTLSTNRNYLSTALKECYQKKFPEFVNTFRVDDAIEMFKEQCEGGKYANYTIQAIGEEVGFIGKNTFHSAFKQTVGVTPSEYLKMLKEK